MPAVFHSCSVNVCTQYALSSYLWTTFSSCHISPYHFCPFCHCLSCLHLCIFRYWTVISAICDLPLSCAQHVVIIMWTIFYCRHFGNLLLLSLWLYKIHVQFMQYVQFNYMYPSNLLNCNRSIRFLVFVSCCYGFAC